VAPAPGQSAGPNKGQYRSNKGHYKHLTVSVLDQPVSISDGLFPGPALCPGTSAAERPLKILYLKKQIL
jgi:hypothetical protein